MHIQRDTGIAVAQDLLEERGAPAAHAFLQADLLVEAELRGHPSHGLRRLPRILSRIDRGLADPTTDGEAYWRSHGFLEVDGCMGLGPVVAMSAVRRIVDRLPRTGIAVAAIRNSNHLGMLAYYVEALASEGVIGIALSTSEALVHPHGGTRAMLGTNPIAIAVPTSGRPMVLDLATSVVSMGEIHHRAATGQPLENGWARDAEGHPTTVAADARHGAIAPFGEAKGYGLGLAVELMVAALAGSALAPSIRGTLDDEHACNKGDVLIAVEPAFMPDIAGYLDAVRASPPADAEQPVVVPGDGANRRRKRALAAGFEIEPRLWSELGSLSLSRRAAVNGLRS